MSSGNKKNVRARIVARPVEPKARRAIPCTRKFALGLREGGVGDALFHDNAQQYLWAQNIVTKAWLAPAVDLRKFSASRPFAYVPPQFLACTLRTKNQQKSTTLGFRTGHTVTVGVHSMSQTYQSTHEARQTLAEENPDQPTVFDEFNQENMVFNVKTNVGHGIDIAAINRDFPTKTEYVPEMFPGLKFDMEEEGVKMRFFDTGELVGMGIKHPGRVHRIFAKAIALARQYPDYRLPPSNKRFEYRKAQKRKASADAAARCLEREN